MLKIHYTCECCHRLYHTSEAPGPEGSVELHALCPECADEIGIPATDAVVGQHFYN